MITPFLDSVSAAFKAQQRLQTMLEEYRQLDQTLSEQVTQNVGLVAANRQVRHKHCHRRLSSTFLKRNDEEVVRSPCTDLDATLSLTSTRLNWTT